MLRIARVGGLCAKNNAVVMKWRDAGKLSSLTFSRSESSCHNKKENGPVNGHALVEEAIEYSIHGPSTQFVHDTYADVELTNIDNFIKSKKHADIKPPENVSPYISQGKINLHGCMQTNVPEPYRTEMSQRLSSCGVTNNNSWQSNLGHGEPKNMPGSGKKLLQKYVSGGQNDVRSFHSSSQAYMQAAELYSDDESNNVIHVFPQGIQGDQCAQYKLWMENCLRYGLPNCDEQLESVVSGRKTLPQIFAEQEELIKTIAMGYKQKHVSVLDINKNENNAISDVQSLDLQIDNTSSPQGIQGDECATFNHWLENCNSFELKDVNDHIQGVQSDMKSFSEVRLQNDNVRSTFCHIGQMSKRSYSTSPSDKESPEKDEKEVGKAPTASNNSEIDDPSSKSQSTDSPPDSQLSQRARLKKAIKEYGSTVIVFHVGISLMSLGGFYLLVSSGVDVIGLFVKAGIGEEFFQSKLAAGASTFVIAYAAHKVLAPVRIGITLTSTPLIVKYLRQKGILKPPAVKKKE